MAFFSSIRNGHCFIFEWYNHYQMANFFLTLKKLQCYQLWKKVAAFYQQNASLSNFFILPSTYLPKVSSQHHYQPFHFTFHRIISTYLLSLPSNSIFNSYSSTSIAVADIVFYLNCQFLLLFFYFNCHDYHLHFQFFSLPLTFL